MYVCHVVCTWKQNAHQAGLLVNIVLPFFGTYQCHSVCFFSSLDWSKALWQTHLHRCWALGAHCSCSPIDERRQFGRNRWWQQRTKKKKCSITIHGCHLLYSSPFPAKPFRCRGCTLHATCSNTHSTHTLVYTESHTMLMHNCQPPRSVDAFYFLFLFFVVASTMSLYR